MERVWNISELHFNRYRLHVLRLTRVAYNDFLVV